MLVYLMLWQPPFDRYQFLESPPLKSLKNMLKNLTLLLKVHAPRTAIDNQEVKVAQKQRKITKQLKVCFW